MYLIGSLGVVLLIAVGTKAFLARTMQLGDLIAFLMLTGFFYEPIGKLHQLNQLVQAGRAAGERVFQIIDESAEPGAIVRAPMGAEPELAPRVGDIRSPDVSFRYVEGLPGQRSGCFHVPPGPAAARAGSTRPGQ